jgi:hypothetical protein
MDHAGRGVMSNDDVVPEIPAHLGGRPELVKSFDVFARPRPEQDALSVQAR